MLDNESARTVINSVADALRRSKPREGCSSDEMGQWNVCVAYVGIGLSIEFADAFSADLFYRMCGTEAK